MQVSLSSSQPGTSPPLGRPSPAFASGVPANGVCPQTHPHSPTTPASSIPCRDLPDSQASRQPSDIQWPSTARPYSLDGAAEPVVEGSGEEEEAAAASMSRALVAVGCRALAEFKAAGQQPQHQEQHARHRTTFEALVLRPDVLQVRRRWWSDAGGQMLALQAMRRQSKLCVENRVCLASETGKAGLCWV